MLVHSHADETAAGTKDTEFATAPKQDSAYWVDAATYAAFQLSAAVFAIEDLENAKNPQWH